MPHGISVIVTAPAAFAWTYEADPERHDRAAELLGGTSLPEVLMALMKDLGVPTGIGALGYTEDDIPALVEGAMAQQRLLVGAPREPSEADLAEILRASLHEQRHD